MQPHVTLDIETAEGRPEDAERQMRVHWLPPGNYKKPEAIGNAWLKAREKLDEKLSLITGAPIISAAFKDSGLRCFHRMFPQQETVVHGALVRGFADERGMLREIRDYLGDTTNVETCLVGHNILHFDLVKLRARYLIGDVQLTLPDCLVDGRQPIFDIMKRWPYFDDGCTEVLDDNGKKKSKYFYSVRDIQEILGLSSHKDVIDGKDVAQLYASNQHETIIKYNLLDVLAEHDLFLRMTGQKPDVEIAQPPATEYATELPKDDADTDAEYRALLAADAKA